ncbi:hypothetical protein GGE06_008354 [Streptomyces sp. SFB5A]|uniref:Uncharacterized protein n=1 Tax=Streptomyces nymphaeiformis TaxID=2663842 RepID=A0A7W7U9C7_9ACTN|nr:hypothetical protein [Streptomyces nymphaeiformis]
MRFAERLVRGDGDAVLLLALGQNLEQQLGAVAVEFHVAELVDAEEVDAAVAGDRLGELLLVGGLDELVDQLRGQLSPYSLKCSARYG